MPIDQLRSPLRLLAVGGALFVGTIAVLPGCGGPPEGTVVPEDAEATAQRNKSMEDYMNSPEGKKSTRAKD